MGRFRYPAGAQTWIYAIPVGACRTSMNSNVHTSATSGFGFPKREEQAPPLRGSKIKRAESRPFLYSYTLCCFCFSTALILSVFLLMMQ